MKAFVTGATGYTGREVVHELRRRDIETVAHVRPDSSKLDHWREKFSEYGARVDSTAWELDAMTRTLTAYKPDIVFHLIGTTKARMKRTRNPHESYEAIDYGLTALFVEALQRAQLQSKFVYLSSKGANPKSLSPYLSARGKAEQAVVHSTLPFVIAQPAVITGEGRDDSRPMERLAGTLGDSALKLAAAVGAKKLSERYQSIDNKALASALVHMALEKTYENQIVPREDFAVHG